MPLGRLGEVFTDARSGKCTDLLQKAREGGAWKMFPIAAKQPIITLFQGVSEEPPLQAKPVSHWGSVGFDAAVVPQFPGKGVLSLPPASCMKGNTYL